MSEGERFAVFMALWIALGIGSAVLFARTKDVALKRKLHRIFTPLVGVVFILMTLWIGMPLPGLIWMILPSP
jgi:hypothetical protein